MANVRFVIEQEKQNALRTTLEFYYFVIFFYFLHLRYDDEILFIIQEYDVYKEYQLTFDLQMLSIKYIFIYFIISFFNLQRN